ncbi:COG4223 family protein [Methylocystis parvus]|uniref:Uncharacterized protein n=1 Tax=Methylocystis parvus TaxID=134 RepID=A0A6B8M6X7_9HYPH|nr:hypothetical protein [Methylocystis parvus]QGM97083.1 hypothetical protein F7D14_06080 [Methylocystis parvus]WBJ99015.1 hypothetical protein MMG94_13530 [Methylocystis parvus OBBP]
MAAPDTEKTDKASKVESPADKGSPATPPARPDTPKKRKGGFLSKLFLSAATLAILAGAAGYGALTFRDADPRIGLAANYVEEGIAEARGALDKAQGLVADLTGEPKPAPKTQSRRTLLDKAPLPPAAGSESGPAPQTEAAQAGETAAPEAAPETPPPAPAETAKEPETPAGASVAETSQPKRADIPEPPRKPVELAQEAPQTLPPPAPVAAPPVPAPAAKALDADGFTDRDLISALEGRIEALSDEVQTLRGKLDAPKSETRAAPETEVAKAPVEKPAPPPSPPAADAGGAAVVVAFALQRELEAGRPFAEEIAALSRLNAEPAPAPALIELSEKGVPTGAQLRDAFLPLAKKLRTQDVHPETPHDSGDIAGHLLEGASKLVKVRPAGQANPESLDGKLDRIEAALGRSDFAAAERIFDSLPEEARAETKEFGETLRQCAEAAKAADELLRGAIAALGKK